MYEALHQRCISTEIIIGEKQYSLWYRHKKSKFFHSNYIWWSCSFFISAVITGVQMREMSKLGWLIGWSSRDIWAHSLQFLYVVLGSICKTLAHSSIFCGLLLLDHPISQPSLDISPIWTPMFTAEIEKLQLHEV
jgi:hypothetical protein